MRGLTALLDLPSLSKLIVITAIGISVGGAVAWSQVMPPLVAGFCALAVLGIVLLMEKKVITGIVLLAFCSRFLVGYLQEAQRIFPYPWDEEFFHNIASDLAQQWRQGSYVLPEITSSNEVYGILSAGFYFLLGSTSLTMRIINALFGAWTIYYIYRISLTLYGDQKTAVRSAFVVSLVPSFIVFTSLHMRDSLIWFTSAISLYHFLLWLRAKNGYHLAIAGTSIAFNVLLRPANLPMILLAFAPFGLGKYIRQNRRSFLGLPFCLLILPTAIGLLGLWGIENNLWGFRFVRLDYISTEMAYRSKYGGAAYLADTKYVGWLDLLEYLPLRMLHFSFGPFIWDVTNAFQLLGALEGTLFFVLLLLTIYHLWRQGFRSIRDPSFLCLLWFGAMGLMANAVVDSNYGTAIRHRVNYLSVFIMLYYGSRFEDQRSRVLTAPRSGITAGSTPLVPIPLAFPIHLPQQCSPKP